MKKLNKIEILLLKIKAHGFKKIIRYLLSTLYSLLWKIPVKNSYSQRNEDIIIDKLLKNKTKGFYVDVGAHDPNNRNNTKRFYNRGWSGINIEPDYNNYLKLVQARPKDINLNIGISDENKILDFYRFIPDTISTFSKKNINQYRRYGFKMIGKVKIKTRKLSDIFIKYAKGKAIDFISIDAEGYDLKVLKSNDWRSFRPKVVCVETHYRYNESNVFEDTTEIRNFMTKIGYKIAYKNIVNEMYITNG